MGQSLHYRKHHQHASSPVFLPLTRKQWSDLFFKFFRDFIYLFLERRAGGRKRGREISMYGHLSHGSHWGPGLQLRHVPQPGIKLATPRFKAHAQSTELHQPGCVLIFNRSTFRRQFTWNRGRIFQSRLAILKRHLHLLCMGKWLSEGPREFMKKPQFEQWWMYLVFPLIKWMGCMLLRSRPHLEGGMVRQSIHDPPLRVISETFTNEIWQSKRKKVNYSLWFRR